MRGAATLIAVLWALCAANGGADNAPLQCSRYCKEDQRMRYEVGRSYFYEYHADTTTGVTGADHRQSRLHLSATVEIKVQSSCDFALKLWHVSLEDSNPADPGGTHERSPDHAQVSKALELHWLRFSFLDGRVAELCPEPGDEPWNLNIKRGLLSAFQTSLEAGLVYERDVAGECETDYEVSRSTFPLVVHRRKDLLSCVHRQRHFLSLQSASYSSPVDATTLPLIKSQQECSQVFGQSGFLERAMCTETHLFRPFSNGDNGAVTKVLQSLIYKPNLEETIIESSAMSEDRSVGDITRTSLLYQHSDSDVDTVSNPEHVAIALLEDIRTKTESGIHREVPRLFSQLVAALRNVGYPRLAKLFSTFRYSPIRKFLLDAMPLVFTPDGMTVMVDLYRSGELSDSELDAWLTTLSFHKKPTRNMLAALSSLLDRSPRPQAILGVTSLVHSFCHQHADCQADATVRDVMAKVEHLLGDSCHVSSDAQLKLMVVALKGIGNAGVVIQNINTLNKCYQTSENMMEVRLAAVDAFRRMPCKDIPHNSLLDIFVSPKQDTELRIATYLGAMTCPDKKALNLIRETLYNEDVNQVASFVWTHLTNMQETSSRWKQGIKELLSNDFLRNKFNTDARKFSRNYEVSKYFESLNAGSSVESNIIFTPQSYLPRSANLNLTVDLFGESFNVFEVGARAEGFENAVEDIFGPGGYFPDQSVKKFMEKFRGKTEQELDNSIDQLATEFDVNEKEPLASIYGRVFGNELLYSRFHGLKDVMNNMGNKSYQQSMLKIMMGDKIDYMKSFSLIDASYVIPTIVGLPLEFSINGSATVGLKSSGNINLKETGFSVVGAIEPSAAVEVTGTMTISAFTTKTGIVSTNTLHTNTYLGGTVRVANGKLIEVKINVPREKMEVLDVSSQLFVLYRDVSIPLEGVLTDREDSQGCSSELVSKIVGMQVCAQLAYANASSVDNAPYFPLTGPLKLQLSLIKTDTFNDYEFNYKVQDRAAGGDPMINYVSVDFDTPGSIVDRKLQAIGLYDRKKSALSVSLRTPFIKFTAGGMLTYGAEEKSIEGSLDINDEELLRVRAGIRMTSNDRKGTIEPFAFLSYSGTEMLDLNGKIHSVRGVKYSADLTLKTPTQQLAVTGRLNTQVDGYVVEGSFNSSYISGSLEAAIRQVSDYVSSHGRVQYTVVGKQQQSIELSNKMLMSTQGDETLKSVQISLKVSEFPSYNLDGGWELRHGMGLLSHSLTWTIGKSHWQTVQLWRHRVLRGNMDYQLMALLLNKDYALDYKMDLKYQTTDHSLVSHAIAHLGPKHLYVASVEYLDDPQNECTLNAELSYSGFNATLGGAFHETRPAHYEGHMEARLAISGRGRRRSRVHGLRLQGALDSKNTGHSYNMQLSGDLQAEVSGSLEQSERSMLQKLELKIGRQTFAMDLQYTFDRHHKVDALVSVAGRQYKGTAELISVDEEMGVNIQLDFTKRLIMAAKLQKNDKVNFDMLEMKLSWDEHINPSNRLYFLVKEELSRSEVVLEYPKNRIVVEVDYSANHTIVKIDLGDGEKIMALLESDVNPNGGHVMAKLETPFLGLESQHIMGRYRLDTNRAEVQGEIDWSRGHMGLTATGSQGIQGIEADLQFISTLPQHMLHVRFSHGEGNLNTSVRGEWYQEHAGLSLTWRVNTSDITGDLRMHSSRQLLPNILAQLRYVIGSNSDKGSLEVTWAENKKIVGNLVLSREASQLSLLAQLTTPLPGYEESSLEFQYKLDDSTLKLEGYAGFNEELTKVTIQASSSNASLEGSAHIAMPSMKTHHFTFSHSSHNSRYKNDFSFQSSGKDILSVITDIALFTEDCDDVLSIRISTPGHNIKYKYQMKIDDENILFTVEGGWNVKTLLLRFVGKTAATLKGFSSLYQGTLSGTAIAKQYTMQLQQHLKPNQYSTTLQIPGNITFTHTFDIENIYNWKNEVTMKTPIKTGSIVNTMNFDESTQEWKHKMVAVIGVKAVSVDVLARMFPQTNLVQLALAGIDTPWTEPIRLRYSVNVEGATIEPEVILQYKKDREFRAKSRVQIGMIKSEIGFELNTPYTDKLLLHAKYNLANPTQVAVLKAQWNSEDVELKISTNLNVDQGNANIKIVQNNIQHELMNIRLEYDLQSLEKTAYLDGHFGEKEMKMDLKTGFSGPKYHLSINVQTPISDWETVSLEALADLSDCAKELRLLFLKQDQSGEILAHQNSSTLNMTLISTFAYIPTASLLANYDIRNDNITLIETMFVYNETQMELHFKLQHDLKHILDGGSVDIELKSPFEGFQHLLGHLLYQNSSENQHNLQFLLQKNDWILKIDGQSSLSILGGNAEINLHLPFRDLTHVSAGVKHSLVENEEHTLSIKLSYDDKEVVIDSSVLLTPNDLSASIEIKTPIEGYEKLRADFTVNGIPHKQKSVSLTLLTKSNSLKIDGALNIDCLLTTADGSINVTFPLSDYNGISAGLQYDLVGVKASRRYIKVHLQSPSSRHEGNMFIDLPRRGKASAEFSISSPISNNMRITSHYDLNPEAFVFSLHASTEGANEIVRADVIVQDSSLNAEFACPILGYNKVTLIGTYNFKVAQKTATFTLMNNDMQFNAIVTATIESILATEFQVVVQTPFQNWEKIAAHGIYDLTEGGEEILKLVVVKGENSFEIVGSWTKENAKEHGSLHILLSTMGMVSITVQHHASDGSVVTFSAEPMDGKKIFDSKMYISDKRTSLAIQTRFKQLQKFNFSSNFDITSYQKNINFYLEYRGIGSQNSPFKINLQADNNRALLKVFSLPISPFYEEMTTSLSYGNVFKDSIHSPVAFTLSINRSKVIKATGSLTLDWANRIGIDLKLQSRVNGKKKFNLYAFSEPKFPPSRVQISSKYNGETLLDFKTDVFDVRDSGFTYRLETASILLNSNVRTTMEVQFYPHDMLIKAAANLTRSNFKDQYLTVITFDKQTNNLQVNISSPIEGYQQFFFTGKHTQNSIESELHTPFSGYEEIKITGNLRNVLSNQKSIKFLINRNENIVGIDMTFAYGEKYADTSLSLMTPFEGLRILKFISHYDLRVEKKTAFVHLENNGDIYKLDGVVLVGSLRAEGQLHIFTPVQEMRKLHFYAGYDFESAERKSIRVSGDVNGVTQAELKFELQHTEENSLISLNINSPIPDTSLTISVVYGLLEEAHLMEGYISVMRTNISISASVSKYLYQGAITSRGPWEVKLAWDTRTKSAEVSLQLADGQRTSFTASLIAINLTNFGMLLSYTTLSYKTYAFNLKWDWRSPDRREGKLDVQWGESKQKLTIETTVQLSESKKLFTAYMGSPVKYLERVTFTSAMSYNDGIISESTLQLSDGKKIVLMGRWAKAPFKTNTHLKFVSPFTQPLQMSVDYNLNGPNKAFNSSFSYGSEIVQSNIQLNSNRNHEISITILTPFQEFTFIHFNGKFITNKSYHSLQMIYKQEDYVTELRVKLDHISLEMFFITPVELLQNPELNMSLNVLELSSLDLKWGKDKYIRAKAFLPDFMELSANTSLSGYETIAGKWISMGPKRFATLSLGNKKLEFHAEMKDDTTCVMNLTTPWTHDLTVYIIQQLRKDNLYIVSLQYGERKYNMDVKLIEDDNMPQMFMKLDSSVNNVSDMFLKAEYTAQSVYINYEIRSFKLSLQCNHTMSKGTAKLLLVTPFINMKNVDAELEINHKESSGFFVVYINDMVSELRYGKYGSWSTKHIGAWLDVNTNNFHLKNASIDLRFPKNGFQLNMGALGEKLELTGSYTIKEFLLNVEGMLNVPFIKSVDHVKVSVNIDNEKYIGSMRLLLGYLKEFTLHISLVPEDLLLSIQTPFHPLRNVTLSGKLVSSEGIHNLAAQAHWEQHHVIFANMLQNVEGDYGIHTHVQWNEAQHITVIGGLKLDDIHNFTEIKSHITFVTLPKLFKDFKFSFNSSRIDEGKLAFNLQLSTPFESIPELKSSLTINKESDVINTNFSAVLLEKELTVSTSLTKTEAGYTLAKLYIQFPFGDPTTIGGNMSCMQWQQCEGYLRMQKPRTSYEVTGTYTLTRHSLDVKTELHTPMMNSVLTFGGLMKRMDVYEANAEIYISRNRASVSYKLDQASFTGELNISIPSIKLPETSFNILGLLNGGTNNQGTFSYKIGKHTGKVGVKFGRDIQGSTLVLADFDVPILFSNRPQSMKLEIKFGKPTFSVDASYNNGRTTSIASLKIQNEHKDLTIVGQIANPSIGEKKASVIIKNNWELIQLQLNDFIEVELKIKRDSGFVILSLPNKQHKLQYYIHHTDGLEGSIQMESPLLKHGTVTLAIVLKNKEDHIIGNVNFESGLQLYSATMELRTAGQKMVRFEVVAESRIILAFDSSAALTSNNIQAEASLEIFGSVTNVAVRHRRGFPLDSEINIMSPLLPQMTARAILNTENDSLQAYAGYGNMSNNQYIMLEAGIKPDIGKVFLDLKMPIYNIMKHFGFASVLRKYNESLTASIDLQLESPLLFSFDISSQLQLTVASLNASIKIKTPIKHHENYEGSLQLPLMFSNNSNFNLSLIFPCKKYALNVVLEQSRDNLELKTLAEYNDKLINGSFYVAHFPKLSLVAEINTPFNGFTHYRLNLKGQTNIKDGNNIVNFVEWNNKRIELRYSFVVDTKKFKSQVELRTPFKGFDRYSMHIEYENNVQKTVIATLGYPGLQKDLGIEFNYLYKGIFDISLVAQMNIPFLPRFGTASVMLANKLDMKEGSYNGIVSGQINQIESSVTLEGVFNSEETKIEIVAHLDQIAYLHGMGAATDNKNIFLWELKTPFPIIKNMKVFFQLAPYEIQALAIYNSQEIIGLNSKFDYLAFNFQFRNPIRPVSFSYSAIFGDQIAFNSEVCWDLNNKLQSQFGVGTTLSNTGFQSELKLPSRVLSASVVSESTQLRTEYSSHFSWEEGKSIGYKLLTVREIQNYKVNITAFARIDLPFRSFESTFNGVINLSKAKELNLKQSVEIFWDAADDRSKKAGIHLAVHNSLEFVVQHALLDHDIIIRWYKDSQLPHDNRLHIIYSSNPENEFILQTHLKYLTKTTYFSAGVSMLHKASRLGLEANVDFFHNSLKSEGKINISYIESSSGQQKQLITMANVNYTKPEILFSVQTTNNRLSVRGSAWEKLNGYRGVSLELEMNEKEPLAMEMILGSGDSSLQTSLSYGSVRQYHARASVPNWREITAEAWHTYDHTRLQDALVTLRLNTTRLLWTTISWQPYLLENIRVGVLVEYEDIALVVNAIAKSYVDLLEEDFLKPLGVFYSSLPVKDFAAYTKNELSDIMDDFQAIGVNLAEMYNRNDFYVLDIHSIIMMSLPSFQKFVTSLHRQLAEAGSAIYESITSFISFIWEALDLDAMADYITESFISIKAFVRKAGLYLVAALKHLNQLKEQMVQACRRALGYCRWQLFKAKETFHSMSVALDTLSEKFQEELETMVNSYLNTMEQYFLYVQLNTIVILDTFFNVVDSVAASLLEVQEINNLLALWRDYAAWLEEFHLQEHIDLIVDTVTQAVELLLNDIDKAVRELKKSVRNFAKPLVGKVDENPVLITIQGTISYIYQKVTWIWHYHKISQSLLEGAISVLDDTDDLLLWFMANIDDDDVTDDDPTPKLVLRPDLGYIEYSQPLPVDWNGFNEMPHLEQFNLPSSLRGNVEDSLTKLDRYSYVFMDPLKSGMSRLPSSKQAMIVGGRHIVTFDGKVYDFEGTECSYLLASDFRERKFSAIVNYGEQNGQVIKKSLTVITGGHHITIDTNGAVTVDGKPTELPVKVSPSAVVTHTGNKVTVQSSLGFTVQCQLRYDICTIQLSNWFFGKTGGLLGTMDNEPFNDLSLPDGSVTTDMAYFARSWQVGRSSRCKSTANTVQDMSVTSTLNTGVLTNRTKECQAYFQNDRSPLEPCFKTVDTLPFYNMCLQTDGGACLAALAYVTQCEKAEVDLWLPSECVRCDLEDGSSVRVGDKHILDGSPSLADIVLVVEEGECLKGAQLTDAVTKLDAVLAERGISSARFTVVGFGGATHNHPHSRTAGGQLWTDHKDIKKALNGLQFETGSEAYSTLLDALNYVTHLPFRGGASRTVVLVACQECHHPSVGDEEQIQMSLTELQDSGITLHVLAPNVVTHDKTGRLYGIDATGTYTGRNLKSLIPSKALLKQASVSRSQCTSLALGTNGTLFNLNALLSSSPESTVAAKKFLEVWARRVSLGALPVKCQRCECVTHTDNVGIMECSPCNDGNDMFITQDWEELLSNTSDAILSSEMQF